MRHCAAKFALVSIVVLPFTGSLAAQGRGPNSVQPDPSAVFLTFIPHRNAPVARGNRMILSSPGSRPLLIRPGRGITGTTSPTASATSPTAATFNSGPAYTAGPAGTPTTTQPEAEEEIAADPADTTGNNLVAAVSDFSQPSGFNFTKWSLSTNGGTTWKENFVPYNTSTGLLTTSDGLSWDANSDPVLAFDQSGDVFLSDLYINVDSFGRITAEGLYVSVDTFSNLQTGNFANTNPVLVDPQNGSVFDIEDKPWITVDNSAASSHQGVAYVSWSHFTGCQNKYDPFVGAYVLTCTSDVIYVGYSTDHGQTWSSPIQINSKGQNGAVQGSQVAVGPDGTVYLVYEFHGADNQRQQFLSVGTWDSTGLTFSAPVAATPIFYDLTFSGCNTCAASYRANSFPNIAVDRSGTATNGSVYMVYGAQLSNTSNAQVNFVACTSNCSSTQPGFSSPVILNDSSAGNAFFPALAVDGQGVIHSSWLDTRNNPSNPDYIDVYATFSSDGGASFAPNARVTSTTMDASVVDGFGDTSFIGDYIGIAATAANPATAHPVWTNASGILGLLLSGSLQTATLTLP